MALKLVFLGRLEDAAGGPERDVPCADTLEAVLAALDSDLASALCENRVRLAVNGTLVGDRAGLRLADGDELAFLPPVSGG